MLEVNITLHPQGRVRRSERLAQICIWNNGTGTIEKGNYGASIRNFVLGETIDGIKVENFQRLDEDALVLLREVLNQIVDAPR